MCKPKYNRGGRPLPKDPERTIDVLRRMDRTAARQRRVSWWLAMSVFLSALVFAYFYG